MIHRLYVTLSCIAWVNFTCEGSYSEDTWQHGLWPCQVPELLRYMGEWSRTRPGKVADDVPPGRLSHSGCALQVRRHVRLEIKG